eukprot:EG_transcript_26008
MAELMADAMLVGAHGPYMFEMVGLGTEKTGPRLTSGQQALVDVAMDHLDHTVHSELPIEALEAALAARPGRWLDPLHPEETELWSVGRLMKTAAGEGGLKSVLQADPDHFTFPSDPNVVAVRAPQPLPATQGKAYKARVRPVVGALAALPAEEAGRLFEAAAVSLLTDPDCTDGYRTVPVPRIWSALVQNSEDEERVGATLGITEKTFPDWLTRREAFVTVAHRYHQNLVVHVRLASSVDWQTVD